MLSNVLIAGYLGVGLVCSSFYLRMREANIKDKEEGKQLEDYQEEELEKIAMSNKFVGGTGTVIIIFLAITLFWLPSILLAIVKDILKSIMR
jgi:hypothetical protein